jgi:peptide/nickel transport system permease protein
MFLALAKQVRRILLTALVGGLLGATLVRLSPGFGIDEREMDSRLSRESQAAAREEHAADRNLFAFYLQYLRNAVHGDLGYSLTLNRPIAELLKERLPVTLASLGYGAGFGMLAGISLALLTIAVRSAGLDLISSAVSGLCLSVPAAVIALFFLWTGTAGRWAIALAVFPHVYRYSKNLLINARQSPHVMAAEARGVSPHRILFAHVAGPVLPQMAALTGVAVSLAFGASIPVEVLCDSPGIGQLAWKAALARDLPVLVSITVLVAILTVTVNSFADLALAPWKAAR